MSASARVRADCESIRPSRAMTDVAVVDMHEHDGDA